MSRTEEGPSVVFHADGYRGESASLVEALRDGRGPGIPCLAWFGMCSDPNADPSSRAEVASDLPPFPTLTRWLRGPDDS